MPLPFRRKKSKFEDDAALKELLIREDNAAVKYVFFEHYTSDLKKIFKKKFQGKPVEYDDIIQELYLHCSEDEWRRIKVYNPEIGSFKNYFLKIADRFFSDYSKKWFYRNAFFLGENPIEDIGTSIDSFPDIELLIDLKSALSSFQPPEDREILEAYLNGEDENSIAKRMNLAVETIQKRRRNAMYRLTKSLFIDNGKKRRK
ncbi:MAG: sigma-70 family RNA polymerase sigma factor [Bacteroidales bacterium]|nr:sigma-70 family RNA polymerase sigma factor [Bacteroidales bacterium]